MSKICFAQQVKIEIEETISREQIPNNALIITDPILADAKSINYYIEKGGDSTSYEIKCRFRNKLLSIEFYENGRLMDIEVLTDLDNISKKAEENIEDYFEDNLEKYKTVRVQRQYSSNSLDGAEVINAFLNNNNDKLTIRYEIIAYVKSEEKFGPYEYLFDHEGSFINYQKVSHRSSDNVLYK